MNKNYLTMILCCVLFSAQAQLWEQYYPDTTGAYGIASDVVQTQDGGFMMAGEIDLPTGAIRHYIQLLKTDANGNEQWRKLVGANYWDVRLDIVHKLYEMPDAGFIMGGSTAYNGQGLYIVRTDMNGDTLWTKIHSGSSNTNIVSNYTKTSNFEFLSLARSNTDLTLYRTDSSGNITLQKVLDDLFTPYDIQEMNNGDYIIVGEKNGSMHLMRTDTQGDTLWAVSRGFSAADAALCVQPLPNGDFIVGGYNTGIVGQSPITIRFDGNGNVIWQGYISPVNSNYSQVSDIALAANGNCIVTGSVHRNSWYSFSSGFSAEIMSNNGQTVWVDTFSTVTNASGAAITMTDDSCFIIAGGSSQSYYLRNHCGTTSTLSPLETEVSIIVAPNPSSDIVRFEINSDAFKTFDLRLFDVSGKLIRTEIIGQQYQLHRKNLSAGVYFYGLYHENHRIGTGKVVFID